MFYRTILHLAALRPFSWLLARLLPRLDPLLMRMSGGKHSLTSLLSGLETVTLTTTGAKSGLPRSATLIPLWDGRRAILIASNFGNSRHPGWHYNLRAHPQTSLRRNGQERRYQACQAQGDERERYYQLAIQTYPGYAAYRQRAAGRQIAVWVLEPLDPVSFPKVANFREA